MKALFYNDWEIARIPELIKEIYSDQMYYWIFHDRQHLTAKKDMVVVDIGANIGLTVEYFAPFSKQIIALEPEEQNFKMLQMNLAYNGIKNAIPIKKALWTETGKAKLTFNKLNTSAHSLVPSFPGEAFDVDTITLEDLVESYKLETIDVLKMDIEGSEYELFKSPTFTKPLEKVREIIIEIHGNDYMNIVKALEANRFFATKLKTDAKCYWATNTRK